MQKKLVVCLGLLVLMMSTPAFATSFDSNYYCVAPYDLSRSFSSRFTKYSGANFATARILGQLLKSQILKKADGDFKVLIDSYSVPDLKNGRFRGLKISGENVIAKDVYFSSVNMQTLCDFNYVVYDKSKSTVYFKEAFPMSFALTFSEDDLNNTMRAVGYENLIEKLNSFGKKYSLFEVQSTTSQIVDNKFVYTFDVKVSILGLKSNYKISLKSDLMVDDGRVVMQNPELISDFGKIDLGKLTKAFDYLNPLEYSLKVFRNKNVNLKVRNVSIVNNKINVSGIMNVPKDVLTQHKD